MERRGKPENPHLTDIFRTALATQDQEETATPTQPSIVVNGNNNVVSFGGRVVIQETKHGARH